MKQPIMFEGFNAYETIKHLHSADLLIHTIPDEEWTLSCKLHPTLLVDVFTLKGHTTGTKGTQTYQCGRLGEILVKLLRYGRNTKYRHFGNEDVTSLARQTHRAIAHTLEEDMLARLKEGDVLFHLIPGEVWRLSQTYFEMGHWHEINVFWLAEESTIGTEQLRIFKSNKLEHVLLEFLCQDVTWRETTSKVLPFRGAESEVEA